jgi:hypothetical protein
MASVVKALAWHTTISRMGEDLRKEYAWDDPGVFLGEDLRKEYAWIVPELMREFLYHEKMLSG